MTNESQGTNQTRPLWTLFHAEVSPWKTTSPNIRHCIDDRVSYVSADIPDAGRHIPNLGLKIRVTGQSQDKAVGQVLIYK